MNIYVVLFFLLFIKKIYSFLIVSIKVTAVDDCIKSISLEDENIYMGDINNCNLNENIEEKIIPYEIGQKINFIIYDIGGECYLRVDVKVNEQYISSNKKKFWRLNFLTK